MLDRLAAGLVTLPAATYDLVLVLTDTDTNHGTSGLLSDRGVWTRLAQAIRPGGEGQGRRGGKRKLGGGRGGEGGGARGVGEGEWWGF